jgi:hypothetical protein
MKKFVYYRNLNNYFLIEKDVFFQIVAILYNVLVVQ